MQNVLRLLTYMQNLKQSEVVKVWEKVEVARESDTIFLQQSYT